MSQTTRRNWWGFFLDYVFFGVGLTLAHTGTVLPAFSATLTSSKALIGAASAVWQSAWLLPQIFAAGFLSSKTKKYPYMIWGAAISRPVFWLFALLLVSGWLKGSPLLLLGIFLFCLAWFSGWDAFVAIAWFDMLGKAVNSRDRGRMIGIGQVVTGVLAVGAGWIIGQLLSDSGPPYPLNYAAVFGLAGLSFFMSFAAIALIDETPEATAAPAVSAREYLAQLRAVWQRDPVFVKAILVRLLAGLSGLAVPFYILHATQVAHLNPQIIGSLAAVSSIGVVVAGIVLGRVAATQGSFRVVQITSWLAIVPPALGLGLSVLRADPSATWVYFIIYLILGMAEGSLMLGFFNYVLDLAPPGGRPTYMGLTNTLGGLLVAAPLIGGWLLDVTSYSVLFICTLVATSAAGIVSLGLPHVHREGGAVVESPELSAT